MIIDEIFNISFDSGKPVDKYDCGQNTILELYKDINYIDFSNLIQHIRESGYAEVQCSCIDNFNSYTFCVNSSVIVFTYDRFVSEMRVIKDLYTGLLPVVPIKSGKCPYRLWQFEVDHSLIDCGMCYIVQFSDYSFFIVDSAHTYSVNDDKRIFDFLRQNTPEGLQVTVKAWFFSHGHVDHIAKFLDILMYNHEIIIEGLYYNFVPNDHFSADSWMHSDKMHTELFLKEVKKRKDIPVYKLHSGQYFILDSVRFDVLCTHEDVFPLSLDNYNDSSTVLMMTVGGDKVCFPGDAGGEESVIIERRFPDFLSCDIMQVAHHGHFGTTEKFYKLANADVALFATTQIKFEEEYHNYRANEIVCELAKHVFVASNGTVGFSFPLKNSEILLYPDETFESFEGVYNLWGYEYSAEYKEELRNRFDNSKNMCRLSY